jgi:putative pre-16S rRNA nuclease
LTVEDGMRGGVRIGIDAGSVRIGVAASDPAGLIATPVVTVPRIGGHLDRIAAIVADREAIEVVVGLPRSLSGQEGPSAATVREFAAELATALAPVPVRLVDERLTTVTAERVLRDRGRKGAGRRAVVDQAAAVVTLQHALDAERASGSAPGETLDLGQP